MSTLVPQAAHQPSLSPQNITTENPSRDVRRFLQHWSDVDFVSERLNVSSPGLPAVTRRAKSRSIAGCIAQGLEYLSAAAATPLLTKPLPLFYAAENLAKATSIARDPALTSSDFKSHGISGDDAKRYSIRNLRCKTSKPGKDTWSHFFRVANTDIVSLTRTIDGVGQVSTLRLQGTAKLPKAGRQLVFGDLVKHLPELVDDVPLVGWGHSYVVHLSSYRITYATGPPPATAVWLTLRHGHNVGAKAMIVSHESHLLKEFQKTKDVMDVMDYHAAAPEVNGPHIRMDVFGDLYMDFDGARLQLSESVIYLTALHILSHAVRYNAEQWKRLLDDHPRESILVDRFLDIALRKLPNLMLNHLGDDVYQFRFAR